jgi:rod shape-determining protein MreD
MSAAETGIAALIVFVAALLQVTLFASFDLTAGAPEVLLVAVAAVALLRGSIVGAGAGFLGGLVADTATLGTLGVSSLVLTVTGYWLGRYGETTGRDRPHAPVVAAFVATGLYAVGASALHFVLGDSVSARVALGSALLPALVLNTLVAIPVYALCRRVLVPVRRAEQTPEVSLLGGG